MLGLRVTCLLFCLPALGQTGRVLSDGLLAPELAAHLQVADTHDQQRDDVGQHEVGEVVPENRIWDISRTPFNKLGIVPKLEACVL